MTGKPTSALVVPSDVIQVYENLRPELRRKLSLRDLDEMRKPYMARIRALEQERDEMRAALQYIADAEPDWRVGVSDNVSRLQMVAQEALDHD